MTDERNPTTGPNNPHPPLRYTEDNVARARIAELEATLGDVRHRASMAEAQVRELTARAIELTAKLAEAEKGEAEGRLRLAGVMTDLDDEDRITEDMGSRTAAFMRSKGWKQDRGGTIWSLATEHFVFDGVYIHTAVTHQKAIDDARRAARKKEG